MKHGLRWRIAATFALLALVVVAIQTALIVVVTDAQEEEFIDRILTDEMSRLRDSYQALGLVAMPNGQQLQGYVLRTSDNVTNVPSHLRGLDVGDHEIFRDGREFHVQVRDDSDARFYLVYDATRHEERMSRFRFKLLIAVGCIAAAAVAAGYALSGVLVSQLADLARRVSDMDPAETGSRLAGDYRDEELATLAAAFDRYHDRVADIVAREKAFTSNVSHELRTPLTTIATSCELLDQDETISGKARQRIERIARAADRMTALTQALLLLARNAPFDERDETVQVKEVAEDVVASLRESLEPRSIALRLRVPDEAEVRAPRPALHLALSNLLRNAIAYTDRGRITLEYRNGILSVTDTGRGIDAADLPRIFDRFYRGEARNGNIEGSGLGLAIVKHIADRLGWTLSVSSESGKGSTFNIEFPPSSRFPHT
jgi:signal transduction histidine kinase